VPLHARPVRCMVPDYLWPDHYEVRIPPGRCQPGMRSGVGLGAVLAHYRSVFKAILNVASGHLRHVPAPMIPLPLIFGKKGVEKVLRSTYMYVSWPCLADRPPCNSPARTVSDPEGSSTKGCGLCRGSIPVGGCGQVFFCPFFLSTPYLRPSGSFFPTFLPKPPIDN